MRISVNNNSIEVSGQRPLIEELREIGIRVPSMCYAEGREHRSSCMVCMVKDVKKGVMLPSCSTMPYEGMEIETDTDEVRELRRLSLELLLSDHRADCEAPCTLVCQRGIDVARVIRLLDEGKPDEAAGLLDNVSCEGCKAPCEKACRRGTVDECVPIREILQRLRNRESVLELHGEVSDAPRCEGLRTTVQRPSQHGAFSDASATTHPDEQFTFNNRLGRFTDQEKERMKKLYPQCLHCACEGRDKCQLRSLASEARIKSSRYGMGSTLPVKEQIPVTGRLVYEPAKCIRCGLCVYNTQDGFTFDKRGFDMRVVVPEESKSHVSEKIASLCPTGALFLKILMPLMLLLTGCRHSAEGEYPNAELPEHPQLMWEHRHNVRTVASPLAYDGMILFCDKHGQMKGLDEDTGEEQFSLSLDGDMEASFTIEDSTLYVGMMDGHVRSLSLTDASERWNYETEGQIAAAPVLTTVNGERRLFVGSYDNYMYTLSPQTGELIHRVPTGYYINGGAALWQGYALFGGCDAWVRIVDGTSGEPTDSLHLDSYIPSSPVVYGDCAYVADYLGDVYELTLSEGHIASHRKLLSAEEDDGGMLSVPIVSRDDVYVLTPDRRLVCLNRKTGEEKWHSLLKGETGECSPVLVDNRLLVCTKTGVVTIHDTSTGQQLWEYETGEQIISKPIVGKSRYYIQTARGTLLCFAEGK